MLVKLKTLHFVCLLADCLQYKNCYHMLYLLCCPTSKKITLVQIWQITRVAPKVMPPIYFHGNYNRYKEHNKTIS